MRHLLLIALVTAGAELTAQASLPKKQIVEELRLDSGAEDFPDVGTVLAGPRGQMVVVINDDQQLRFYDATGRKIATLGRKGSGPAEFQRMTRQGWVGDTLWIFDISLRRVTYVFPAGTLLRSEVLPGNLSAMSGRGPAAPGAIGLYSPMAIVGGRYVGSALVVGVRNPDGTVPSIPKIMSIPASRPASGDLALTPAGDTAGTSDRIFLADQPSGAQSSVGYRPGDGSSYSAVIPFTFYPTTVFSPDGARFASITTDVGEKGGTYTVVMLSTKGDTIFHRTYPFTGVPIPSSVSDSALNAIGVGSDGKPFFPPQVQLKLREAMQSKMPKVYSPVSSMILGADGTAWISGRNTPQGRTVTAIDPKGNPLFTVDLPPKTRLVQANRATL